MSFQTSRMDELMARDEFDQEQIGAIRDHWACPNKTCYAHHRFQWSRDGELYFHSDLSAEDKKEFYTFLSRRDERNCMSPFIGNLCAPFGTFERKLQAERRKDENTDISIWKFRIESCFNYTADEDGNILSRKRKLKLWIKENQDYTLYISGIYMLWFSIRWTIRDIKKLLDTDRDRLEIRKTLMMSHPTTSRKGDDWWRHVAAWVNRKLIDSRV